MSATPNKLLAPVQYGSTNKPGHATICRGRSIKLATLLLIGWIGLGMSTAALAQEAIATTVTTPSLEDASLEEVQQQYNDATEKLRSSLKKVQASGIRFFSGSSEESEEQREEWQQAVDAGNSQIELLRAAAMELFRRQDRPSDEVIDLALRSGLLDVSEERYHVGLQILERANSISPTPRSKNFMARVQLLDNKFEAAKAFFAGHPEDIESLTQTESYLYQSIDELISQFKREQQLREAEAESDDLPRVELITSQGRIVLELFENEAPQTVANFINLVEQGFYNGVIFS